MTNTWLLMCTTLRYLCCGFSRGYRDTHDTVQTHAIRHSSDVTRKGRALEAMQCFVIRLRHTYLRSNLKVQYHSCRVLLQLIRPLLSAQISHGQAQEVTCEITSQ